MYRLGESPYEFVFETIQRWKNAVDTAFRIYGKSCAGMDPVEMLELDEKTNRLRLFVLGSDPVIEIWIEEGDWQYKQNQGVYDV